MAVVSKFALLRLPKNEILRTIRAMDLEQILKFSFISKKCKELVTSIQIKGVSFTVHIGNDIDLCIQTVSNRNRPVAIPHRMDLRFYSEPDMYWGIGSYGRKKRLLPPQSVLISVETAEDLRTSSKWTKSDCTMRDWLEHLQGIFSYHKIDSIWFRENSSEFDISDIKDVFGNITGVKIENTGCRAFNQLILQQFFPIEDLTILTENYQDSKIPPSLLIQNRATLVFDENLGGDPTNATLNDLLLINSKVIIVELPQAPEKLLNKFIKLWQRGSNPRMEYLGIAYFGGGENDKEVIMKGIKHQVIPDDRVRNFKSVGLETLGFVRGGMDVYRFDGMKATIAHQKSNGFCFCQMFVWFDHCIVEF